jgi:type IX secretion system PorP/SprF family membrane protein
VQECMSSIKKFLVIVLVIGSFLGHAQQPEIYNQFFMNPYLYNPAYAGVEGHTVIYALYHNQWANIEGAPQISHVSFHTPLKGGIGIGAMAFNDTQGLLSKTQGKISASYLITMDREHHLRLGMSIGGGTQGVNFGELDDPSDPAFLNISQNTSYLLSDFGATYHFGHFNLGFSIPNLISYDQFQSESLSPLRVKPLDNMMFKVNYRGHISHDLAIEPHLIYRFSNIVPDQLEGTVIFHIYHVMWAGATYRQDNTFAVTIGAKIKEKIAVGYGYELGNLNISNLLGPTHEIHIGFHLGSKKAHASHVSSFIKSHQLSPEQRATLAAKEREEQLQELQSSRSTPQAGGDELSIAGRSADSSDELSIAGGQSANDETQSGETASSDSEVEKKWTVDTSSPQAVRTNPFGEQEKALVIKSFDEQGEEIYAVAWEPVEENWELMEDEAPIIRKSSDGTSELGVKYLRENADGQKQMIVKWEPVVTKNQMDDLMAGSSTSEIVAQNISNSAAASTPPETEPTVDNSQPTERNVAAFISDSTPPSDATESAPIEDSIDNGNVVDTSPNNALPVDNQLRESTPDASVSEVATTPSNTPSADTEERSKGDENLTGDFRSHEELAASDDHLEVTRGDNMLELPAGYYLIGGAFEEFEHAENLSDQLFEKGYHDVIVGFLSARGYYYTVVSRHDSLNQANSSKNSVKQRPSMKEVWVLKVNN